MYRSFVRHNVRQAFAALSRGETSLLDAMDPQVHHSFPGHGALGGERTSREDVADWLARLYRVLPGLTFDVRAIAVDGPPWNTVVGVEWDSHATVLDGSAYRNRGAHVLRLRNGRIVAFHAYLDDAAALDDTLARLAAHGVEEAAAPPVGTPAPAPAR